MSRRRDRAREAKPSAALAGRAAAVRAVTAVLRDGRSLGDSLPRALAALSDGRGVAQDLAYGVLRWHGRLSALAGRLLDRPLKPRDTDVVVVLETGLYQLTRTEVPAQWVVSECVDTVRLLGKHWAAGLLNATLRRFLRESESLGGAVDADPCAALSHPAWLLERLRTDWPEHWRAVAAANNERPPMTLRVNARRVSREDYQRRLAAAGIEAAAQDALPEALTLATPIGVEALPGFGDGDVSVQDAGAQLAAHLTAPAPGDRVLDACAAPGGKTGHLLELEPGIAELVAIDSDPRRLERVGDNLRRLGLRATLRAADAADVDGWWDGQRFQRILLDAPCTGTGVIRRHPDIKWLRRREDPETMAAGQRRLLEALWPLLAPGGKLVYCTCSVLAAENEAVVAPFAERTEGVRLVDPGRDRGLRLRHGRQILPGFQGMDGFYYAGLEKTQ